jgi:hypothetical protein
MKRLLAAMVLGLFVASAVATSTTDYSKWSTTQLKQTRLELYKQIPFRGNRKNIAIYVKHGEPLPAEDEIQKIEQELNRRLTHGDKDAYFEPAAPNLYRHKNPAG